MHMQIFIYSIENEIFFMGNNYFGQSGIDIGNKYQINEIIKLNYFEKGSHPRENKEIKKISCGGSIGGGFTIFLTGNLLFYKI
jgi:hypothetical protein